MLDILSDSLPWNLLTRSTVPYGEDQLLLSGTCCCRNLHDYCGSYRHRSYQISLRRKSVHVHLRHILRNHARRIRWRANLAEIHRILY